MRHLGRERRHLLRADRRRDRRPGAGVRLRRRCSPGLGERVPQQILLTHIHLDHAGATGALVRRWPDVEVWVHERGAPHVIDPRSWSPARRALRRRHAAAVGRDRRRSRSATCASCAAASGSGRGASSTRPGTRSTMSPTCTSRAAPPSAATSRACKIGAGPVLPPTPPPDIDVEAWTRSLDMLEAWAPARLVLTHFGLVERSGAVISRSCARTSSASRAGARSRVGRFRGAVRAEIESISSPQRRGVVPPGDAARDALAGARPLLEPARRRRLRAVTGSVDAFHAARTRPARHDAHGRARRAARADRSATPAGSARCSAEPEVATWWGSWDVARVQASCSATTRSSGSRSSTRASRSGIVGWWQEADPQYHFAGIDISLRTDAIGRGLGADAVRTLARWLLSEGGHHRVTIDPAADERARDPLLRARRLPAGRRDARVRDARRRAPRRPADGPAGRRPRRRATERDRRAPTSDAAPRRAPASLRSMPSTVELPRTSGPGTGLGGAWRVIVKNDDHNTFDHVADVLARFIPGVSLQAGYSAGRPHRPDRSGDGLERAPRARRALLGAAARLGPDDGPARAGLSLGRPDGRQATASGAASRLRVGRPVPVAFADRARPAEVVPDVERRDLPPARRDDAEVDHLRGRSTSDRSRPWRRSRPSGAACSGRRGCGAAARPSRRSAATIARDVEQRALQLVAAQARRVPGDVDHAGHQAPTSAWIAPGPSARLALALLGRADEDRDLARVLVLVHQLVGLGDLVEGHRLPQHGADQARRR